jgi:cytochrome c-type biogenesis protein CcmH
MKHLRPFAVLASMCMVFAAHAAGPPPNPGSDPLPFKDRAQEVRFQKLTSQLRCLVCQNESLAASQAELAKQMRHIIFRQMQKGWSNEQIKQYLVARYSDYVLYDPPLKPTTWLLWFGPAGILILGAGVVLYVVRKRARSTPEQVPVADDEDW